MKNVRMAALAVALLATASLAACSGPTRPPTGAPSGKTPVVFIHGYIETPAMWNSFVSYLKSQGYSSGDIMNVGYVSSGLGAVSATQGAAQLAKSVDDLLAKTGKTKVDIVAHSLGNLITKTCIVEGGCAGKVAHWQNVAGANNGTQIAWSCPDPACTDMRPGSAHLRRLTPKAAAAIAEQGVKVQVHWTLTDGVILPPTNSQEPFAKNIHVLGETHLTISNNRQVQRQAVQFFTS